MFEWQVGNTTRFIKFEDITEITSVEDGYAFYVMCGKTTNIVPESEHERFDCEYTDWNV